MNSYSITVKLTSLLSGKVLHLTNIYGPSAADEKVAFISWLYNFNTYGIDDWVLAGDFNLLRSPNDRNRPGGNVIDMLLFNDVLQHLDVLEIPFQGCSYSWNNMQNDPLLEKFDWVFTSAAWALSNPDTKVTPLSKPTPDHIPYVINIGTSIPKSSLFRFENHWVEHGDFLQTVERHWNTSPYYANAAKTLSAKFKQVRARLKN